MKLQSLIYSSLLVLACVLAPLAYSQTARREPSRAQTDGIPRTSGENGKWVKGCPPTPCNMGVGNLGPANTYHWEGK